MLGEIVTPKDPEVIALEISRDCRTGNIGELQRRINYIEHVKGNSTKSMSETIISLHEEINNLGAHLTVGAEIADIEEIQKVWKKLIDKGIVSDTQQMFFQVMMAALPKQLEEKKIDIGTGLCICIALSPDNKKVLVHAVPKKD